MGTNVNENYNKSDEERQRVRVYVARGREKEIKREEKESYDDFFSLGNTSMLAAQTLTGDHSLRSRKWVCW